MDISISIDACPVYTYLFNIHKAQLVFGYDGDQILRYRFGFKKKVGCSFAIRTVRSTVDSYTWQKALQQLYAQLTFRKHSTE